MFNAFIALALRTIMQPRDAAEEIIALRPNRSTLWSALCLAVVLNTIAYQFSLVMSPPSMALPLLFSSPFVFALLIGFGLVLSVYSVTYMGRFIGGSAILENVMALLIWLQFMRFAVQLAAVVLVPLVPGLAGLLVLFSTLYGMWILMQFVDIAHGFDNLFSSFGTLFLSGIAMMLGLAILLSIFGIQNMGIGPLDGSSPLR